MARQARHSFDNRGSRSARSPGLGELLLHGYTETAALAPGRTLRPPPPNGYFRIGPDTSSTRPPGLGDPRRARSKALTWRMLRTSPSLPAAGAAATTPAGAAGVSAGGERTGSRAAGAASRLAHEPGALAGARSQAWTRAAEWGPTLLVLGAWSAAVLLLVYFARSGPRPTGWR